MNYVAAGNAVAAIELLAWGALLFVGFVAYLLRRGWGWLLGVGVVLRIMVPILLSYLQYRAWSAPGKGLTQLLLPPHQTWSYFLGYVWTNIVLQYLLVISVALAVGIGLWALSRYRAEAMLPDELFMGTFAVLAMRWPQTLFVVPLALSLAALEGVMLRLTQQEKRTQIGIWFLVAAVFVMAFGDSWVEWMSLEVLRIGR